MYLFINFFIYTLHILLHYSENEIHVAVGFCRHKRKLKVFKLQVNIFSCIQSIINDKFAACIFFMDVHMRQLIAKMFIDFIVQKFLV